VKSGQVTFDNPKVAEIGEIIKDFDDLMRDEKGGIMDKKEDKKEEKEEKEREEIKEEIEGGKEGKKESETTGKVTDDENVVVISLNPIEPELGLGLVEIEPRVLTFIEFCEALNPPNQWTLGKFKIRVRVRVRVMVRV
jgi:hypothetical protein